MIDLLAIANALKPIANVEGVKECLLGVNQSFPNTPACEVIVGDGRLRSLAAGANDSLENLRVQVVYYVALTQNLETDEQTLLPIVTAFINALAEDDFDYTLGGHVEDVRVIGFEFDVIKRNNLWFRYGSVELICGDVDGET